MRIKIIAVIALIALAMFIVIKPVSASPDKYYLEGGNVLTTTAPRNPFISQKIGPGVTWTNTWLSESMEAGVTISGGTYYFRFYMDSTPPGNIIVQVTFTFGYYDGQYHEILTVGPTDIVVPKTPTLFTLRGDGGETDIPAGSRLYLTVSIYNTNSEENAYFIYSGFTYNTHIETPAITVPEFPIGVFLLPPMLLALYFISRRRLLKS